MNQTPTVPAAVRSGLFMPRFGELANPVADPSITLAAIATATTSIRLGPLVTPLARRRPVKVARETASLDQLCSGRLTLGVGLGSDRFGQEFSITGEEVDDGRRARMLDEVAEIEPGQDPTPDAAAGATWWLAGFPPETVTIDLVRRHPRALTEGA